MFCPNCGSEIKDGDMFCGECGAKVEPLDIPKKEAPKQEKQGKPQTKKAPTRKSGGFHDFSDKAKKIVIAEIAVLVVLIAAFFYIGNRNSSPGAAAKQFVKDYNNKKWSKIYDSYNFDSDTFINADAFEKTMNQSETKTLLAPVGGYVRYGENAGQYIYQSKKGSDEVKIQVAKSTKKNFFFFDKYEVTSVTDTGLEIESVTLCAIPDVTLKIDGITAKVPDDIYGNTYDVNMFAGTHKITFSGADGMFTQKSYTFKTSDDNPMAVIKYSSEAKTEAAKALKNYMPAITEATIKDKDNLSLASYFTSNEAANSYGGALCGYGYGYGSDTKGLGSVQLTKCQAIESSDDDDNTVADGIAVMVTGSRTYKYATWGGSYDSDECEIRGVAKMVKKNGTWLIDSASSYY